MKILKTKKVLACVFVGGATLLCVSTALSVSSGELMNRADGGPRSDCIVATVGEFYVTQADGLTVQSLIRPPPTSAESRRLALAVTQAFVSRNPGALQVPPIEKRLEIYRELLRGPAEAPGEAAIALGPCGLDAHPGALAEKNEWTDL